MADDELVGNMDTERMIPYLEEKGMALQLDKNALRDCGRMASDLFI